MVTELYKRGWAILPYDATLLTWVAQAKAAGLAAMQDPDLAQWWVCENTWFVGVDALPNDAAGAMPGGLPLGGAPKRAIEALFGALPRLHKGQLSVVRPGYPRPRAYESAAAFRYRQNRDAAHVDGIKPFGPDRQRRIDETHAWILGVPLTENEPDEAPLVVWDGSHEIVQKALADALSAYLETDWPRVDITQPYQDVRRKVFETCARIPLPVQPGQALLMHRLTLHGVAPWRAESASENQHRMMAYFRPPLRGSVANWLNSI